MAANEMPITTTTTTTTTSSSTTTTTTTTSFTTTPDPSSKAELILSLHRSVDPSQCRCQVVMGDATADTPPGDRGATLLVSLRFGSANHCVDTLLVDSVDTRWVNKIEFTLWVR